MPAKPPNPPVPPAPQPAPAGGAADATSRAKHSFLANISHEIRTPMNAIIGFAHLMRRDPLSPRQLDHLDRIEQASQHLLQLINDILDFARIESQQVVLLPADVCLHDSLRKVMAGVADEAAAKGLALQLDMAQAPEALFADRARLEQVLGHLVGNAVKFTQQGHVLLRVLPAAQGDLRFEVHDSGPGVPLALQPHLFEAFEQADVSTTRRFGGAGLGLAICRRLVLLMQGRIGVASQPGAGSLFWFEVPSTRSGRPGAPPPVALDQASPAAGQAQQAEKAEKAEQAAPAEQAQLARLARVPGLLLNQGLARVGGDWPLYHQALGLFARHHGQDGTRLLRLAEQGDVAGLRQLAHALAGAASTLAAAPVAQRARVLEQALLAEPDAPAAAWLVQLVQPVLQVLQPLLAGLRQVMADAPEPASEPRPSRPDAPPDGGAAPTASAQPASAVAATAWAGEAQPDSALRRQLLQLQPLLHSHDMAALELLAPLQPQLALALGPLAATLALQVQSFSFEEARLSLDRALQQLV